MVDPSQIVLDQESEKAENETATGNLTVSKKKKKEIKILYEYVISEPKI